MSKTWQEMSKDVCLKIKERLNELNWSFTDFADKTNFDNRFIDLIKEEKAYFTNGTLHNIEERLDIKLNHLWY